ncbi:hypothetical protein F7725_016156 [Dissostichus mawsoni]|uniref:NADH dehydrogenase [ubiquinone] 1 beta subcomplex subunit 7 n=1 Tax=Dissostichus mawsoni TaxID=36200 RepID=A0A7J5Y6Z0_DISMA|nr:hypothetical protein F7725_016156 [Dissostichus mawsoni]
MFISGERRRWLVECIIIVVAMGAHLVRRYVTETDTEPDPTKKYEFDPSLALKRGKREMVATQDQMNLAQLPLEQRDYCAQHLLKLMKCKRDNWPNFLACKHERHDWGLLRTPGLRDAYEGVREREEAPAEEEKNGVSA